MAEPARDDDIAAHITSIASRSHSETAQLAKRLRRRSWPGGHSDRTEPVALGWIQRWSPRGPAPLAQACDCAGGRCLVCN